MRKLGSAIALLLLISAGALAAGQARPTVKKTIQPPAAPASAAQGSAAMQSFTSTNGLFKIEFPGTPKQVSRPLNLQGGGNATMYQYWVDLDNDDTTYMVIYNDYPPDYASASPQALLETMRDGVVRGKTLTSDVPIELFGVPGRAFTAVDKDGWQYAVHQFLDGSRFYQLIVVNSKNHPAGMTEQFMNSFRILGNPNAGTTQPAQPPAD